MKAQKTPSEIIGDNVDILRPILRGWNSVREKMSWDEYSVKLKPDTKDIMASVFKELRRNGYYNLQIWEDKIVVDYICYPEDDMRSETLDICTLCENDCVRKDWRGVFMKDNAGDEMRRCWK